MKIYGKINTNIQLIIDESANSGSEYIPDNFIKMNYPKPSINFIARSDGEWVENNNYTIIKERVLNSNSSPFLIKNDIDLDRLPNGFTGFISFVGHPIFNNFGIVLAHVISAGETKDYANHNYRAINIESHDDNGNFKIHGYLIRIKNGILTGNTNYKFIDYETRYTLNSEFKIRGIEGVYSSIDLPSGKMLVEGNTWLKFVSGYCLFTLPFSFKNNKFSMVFNDTGDETRPIDLPSGCFAIAAIPANEKQMHIWARDVKDGSLVNQDPNKPPLIRCTYFGMGNR